MTPGAVAALFRLLSGLWRSLRLAGRRPSTSMVSALSGTLRDRRGRLSQLGPPERAVFPGDARLNSPKLTRSLTPRLIAGLSRRRSRVRVPSLPSTNSVQIGNFPREQLSPLTAKRRHGNVFGNAGRRSSSQARLNAWVLT